MAKIKNCLVTGASGFLGRALCRSLQEQGCRVDVVGRSADSVNYVGRQWLVDLGSESIPAEALNEIDTVFYLAGIAHASRSSPLPDSLYLQVNYKACVELLEKSLCRGVKCFVYISSVKAGFSSTDLDQVDAYSRSKYLAEKALLAAASNSSDMQIVILRPCLIYGAGVSGNLQSMLNGIQRGWFPPLPPNTGKRSMIHREDVVSAMLCAATNKKAHAQCYILADSKPMCVREIQDAIRSALGLSKLRWHIPLAVFNLLSLMGDFAEKMSGKAMPVNSEVVRKMFASECYSSEKIQRELGWLAKSNFSDCVAGLLVDAAEEAG